MARPHTVTQTSTLWRAAPYDCLWRRLAQCMALVVIMGILTVLGCSSDSGTTFVPATANDLTNQAFTFTNGAGANLATLIGLPQAQAFTLQFGNFGGTNVGPVTLDSGGSTASGTVTIGSCTFRFDRSTFPTARGPQSG